MSPPNHDPSPEDLAAFADGELTADARQRVEDHLASHPEAAAEIDDLRRLDRLWQQADPPQPSDATWTAVLGRIEANVTAPARGARWRSWLTGLGAGLAAALALAVLWPAPRPVDPPDQPGGPSGDSFPVAAAHDVEIISVEDADLGALVVGDPPLREPLVLAELTDVDVKHVGPDADGLFPRVPAFEEFVAPMIVAPAKKP